MTTENTARTRSTTETRHPDRPGRRRVLQLSAAVALLPAMAITGGCGQKGPLYVPESETESEEKKSSG